MVALVVMNVNVGPKIKKQIAEKVQSNKCLCCDKPMLKRGLCYQCYYAWRRERNRLTSKAKQVEFDALLIRKGRLLDQQAVRDYKGHSVFTSAAEQVS